MNGALRTADETRAEPHFVIGSEARAQAPVLSAGRHVLRGGRSGFKRRAATGGEAAHIRAEREGGAARNPHARAENASSRPQQCHRRAVCRKIWAVLIGRLLGKYRLHRSRYLAVAGGRYGIFPLSVHCLFRSYRPILNVAFPTRGPNVYPLTGPRSGVVNK